jgi:hypothetical protein
MTLGTLQERLRQHEAARHPARRPSRKSIPTIPPAARSKSRR